MCEKSCKQTSFLFEFVYNEIADKLDIFLLFEWYDFFLQKKSFKMAFCSFTSFFFYILCCYYSVSLINEGN